jgi:hypothetical protein
MLTSADQTTLITNAKAALLDFAYKAALKEQKGDHIAATDYNKKIESISLLIYAIENNDDDCLVDNDRSTLAGELWKLIEQYC